MFNAKIITDVACFMIGFGVFELIIGAIFSIYLFRVLTMKDEDFEKWLGDKNE